MKKRQYASIDIARYISALLVVCIHTFPFLEISETFNTYCAIDSCYESILNSLEDNEQVVGNEGHIRYTLSQLKKSST